MVVWASNLQLNGRITRSTRGGGVRRYLQVVLTATPKPGLVDTGMTSGGRESHAGHLVRNTGKTL